MLTPDFLERIDLLEIIDRDSAFLIRDFIDMEGFDPDSRTELSPFPRWKPVVFPNFFLAVEVDFP